MPVGFVYTTSHHTEITLDGLAPEDAVLISINAVNALGWEVLGFAENALVARSRHEELLLQFYWDKMLLKSVSSDNRAHDWGANRRNLASFQTLFDKLRSGVTQPVALEALETVLSSYPAIYNLAAAYPRLQGRQPETRGWLFRQGFVITPILIMLNFLIYLFMAASGADLLDPSGARILSWGGNFAPVTLSGEWWRIITAQFVHIGLIHLLTNMLALLFIGMTLEPLMGKSRFITAYILSGICGSLLSMYMHPDNLSAGASGCIFGLLGVFLALMSVNLTDRENRKRLLPVLFIYIIYLLAGGLREERIDVSAHSGGLLGGLLIGYAFLPGMKEFSDRKRKYASIARVVMTAIVIIILAFNYFSKLV